MISSSSSNLLTSCGFNGGGGYNNSNAYLRKVLNTLFPPSYIEIYHNPLNSICTLLNITKQQNNNNDNDNNYEVSTEPISRFNLLNFRDQFNSSLVEHQAKLVGLCPIRRAIYDQCFDELIRQVTVGCIEQGLLLFRIRNELRMTINYYRKAYESGVKFGLNKAIEAELMLEENIKKMEKLEFVRGEEETDHLLKSRINDIEIMNELESIERMKEYYKNELNKRDKVIEQQRALINALSQSLKLPNNN